MNSDKASRTGKPYVAIAVANHQQREKMATALQTFYQLGTFSDTTCACADLHARPPAVAVVGDDLLPLSGYDFVTMLRLDPILASIPVVMMVANDGARTREAIAKCGAQTHLLYSCTREVLVSTISRALNAGIERQWQLLPPLQKQALNGTLSLFNGISDVISNNEPISYSAVRDACKPLIEAVGKNDYKGILQGVKDHDNYTYAHSLRVATLLALFGSNLRLSTDEQSILVSGGLLHDVGKTSIPNEVLNKPGRLTPGEFDVMKGHVNASVAYLHGSPDLPKGVLTIAAQHHEKLDGTGYPYGLSGKKLDTLARMASIIDVFSALTDRRVYKPSMGAEAALKLMVDQMSSHLDMTLLVLFRQMLLDAEK